MNFSLSPELTLQLKSIKQKDLKLFKKIQKQLSLFKENNRHPSLRTHKLKGAIKERWSISIEGNTRMLFYVKNEEAVFYIVGTHDEVYREN
jgi:mRNA-degrading endonuclease YafQ of YafQ-DinJ toxin-antitoxin module